MSVRRMLLVCVLAVAVIIPLVGCKGSTDKKSGGGTTPSKTSNTTTAE